MESSEETREKSRGSVRIPLALIAAAAVLAIAGAAFWGWRTAGEQQKEPEIVSASRLEKIVNVSELSTFTAVYNGVAEVKNEEDPDKTDCYVSYEAKVNAGIDFSAVEFSVDPEAKVIRAALPPVHISRVNVDIASMDYIFLNSKRNASGISQDAYKACEADAQRESESEHKILELAQQNAENIVRALLLPFIEQLEEEYDFILTWEAQP